MTWDGLGWLGEKQGSGSEEEGWVRHPRKFVKFQLSEQSLKKKSPGRFQFSEVKESPGTQAFCPKEPTVGRNRGTKKGPGAWETKRKQLLAAGEAGVGDLQRL